MFRHSQDRMYQVVKTVLLVLVLASAFNIINTILYDYIADVIYSFDFTFMSLILHI
jgi:predicted outer membrane lipoprotein